MYKRKEFAKIVDIPEIILQYYAENNILVPNYLDKETGKRYYDENNINESIPIKYLENLGFTTSEIIKYKDNINNDIINNKKEEIAKKINKLTTKYQELTTLQKNISKEEKNISYKTLIKVKEKKYNL